jgi:hypothetical protein
MAKRELSIVELQEIFAGIADVNIDGKGINIHLDGHYIGIPVNGLYRADEGPGVIGIRNSHFWLSYYQERGLFHLTVM